MAKAKAASLVKARILTATIILGESIKADDVVSGSEEQINDLVASGVADKNASAVKYALGLDGNRVIDLVAPEPAATDLEQAKQALADEIVALEDALAKAGDDVKAGIETQIAAKREELASLED